MCYNLQAAFTLDSDYRVTRVAVGPVANPCGVLSRSLSWTGDDVLNAIVDNLNPGTGQTGVCAAQTQIHLYAGAAAGLGQRLLRDARLDL